jgi:hypothetical protein
MEHCAESRITGIAVNGSYRKNRILAVSLRFKQCSPKAAYKIGCISSNFSKVHIGKIWPKFVTFTFNGLRGYFMRFISVVEVGVVCSV